MLLLKQRRTPWDVKELTCSGDSLHTLFGKESLPEPVVKRRRCMDAIYLHGHWLVDASRVTPADARQFMWAGLRTLRVEAKAIGLTEEQVDCLLVSAFDAFHDAAESIWTALKAVQSIPHHSGLSWEDFRPTTLPFRPWTEDLMPAGGCVYTSFCAGPSTEERQGATPSNECAVTSMPSDLFTAWEEDRPVPVKLQFKKPLTLIDPDAEILASFEP